MTAARAWVWTTVLITAGALVSAVMLAPPAGTPPLRAVTWLLFAGSSVHVASTGWLFTVPEVRAYARHHAVRCLWVPVGLVVLGVAAAAAAGPGTISWLLMPFFGWQFWHYQKQNIGVAALAASAERAPPLLPAERRPLLLAGASAIAALAARPGLLGLRVTPVVHLLFPLAGLAYAIAVAAGLTVIVKRWRARRSAGFCAAYIVSLFFVLPVFCLSSPYAAVGGMTIAHGLQYLILVSLVASVGGRAQPFPFTKLALLANIALIGGAALNWASHLHNAAVPGRLVFGAYVGIVMAHFVIDAGLWRTRDPLARHFITTHLPYLVPSAPRQPESAEPVARGRLPMDRQPI
jgi:hypothetical protein